MRLSMRVETAGRRLNVAAHSDSGVKARFQFLVALYQRRGIIRQSKGAVYMSGAVKKLEKIAKDPATLGTALGGITGGALVAGREPIAKAAATEEGQIALLAGGTALGALAGGPVGALAGASLGQSVGGVAVARADKKAAQKEATRAEAMAGQRQADMMAAERAASIAAGRRRDRLLRSRAGRQGTYTAGVSLATGPVTGAGLISGG